MILKCLILEKLEDDDSEKLSKEWRILEKEQVI